MIQAGNAQLIGEKEYQNDYFSIMMHRDSFLGVIADGLGDRPAAKTAAIIVVETLKKNFFLNKHVLTGADRYFRESVNEIKTRLRFENYGNVIGATLIAVLIRNGMMYFASLGDCLLFLYRRHEMIPLNQLYNTEMEIKRIPLEERDIAVLCSKGARESLTEMELIWQMRKKIHPYSKCQNLISRIRSKSLLSQDNATIVIIDQMLHLPVAARG
jgi:serine/threonine protein phosphatase PrpC